MLFFSWLGGMVARAISYTQHDRGSPMKLTLRELFLLVVIAAMGCGWWVDRQTITRASAAKLSELVAEVNRLEVEALQRRVAQEQSGWPLP